MLAARTHHGLRASCCARPSTCTAHTYVDYMYRYIAVSLSAQHSFRLMRNTCTISYWKFLPYSLHSSIALAFATL